MNSCLMHYDKLFIAQLYNTSHEENQVLRHLPSLIDLFPDTENTRRQSKHRSLDNLTKIAERVTCGKFIVREYMEINENTCRPKIRSAIVSGRGFLLICSHVCCVLGL